MSTVFFGQLFFRPRRCQLSDISPSACCGDFAWMRTRVMFWWAMVLVRRAYGCSTTCYRLARRSRCDRPTIPQRSATDPPQRIGDIDGPSDGPKTLAAVGCIAAGRAHRQTGPRRLGAVCWEQGLPTRRPVMAMLPMPLLLPMVMSILHNFSTSKTF